MANGIARLKSIVNGKTSEKEETTVTGVDRLRNLVIGGTERQNITISKVGESRPKKIENKINSKSRATQESARERYSIRQDEARKRTEAKEQKERLERLRTIEASMPEYQKPEWAQKIAQAEQALANTQQQQNEIFARKQEQRIADLNRVMANRDFLEYAEQGKATANPTWDQAARNLGELQNPVAFANQNADYLKRMQASTMGFEETGALTSRTADLVKYTYMTQAEQNTYNYYLAKEGKEKAQEYLDALDRRLDERRQAALNEETKQNAAENKISGIVGNLVSSYFTPGAFLETIRQNVENANTGEYAPVNAYSPAMMGVHAQTATREGVTGDIESPTLKFLADTGLSIGQNLVRYPMGPLGLGMMGLGAAGSTATEATLRGATADQALELGTIAGAAEVLTEKLPMDNFFRLLKTGSGSLKSAMLEALKQVGTEASEEMVSEYVNRIADTVIMGDLSEMNQYITELVSAGYSQEEAEKTARSEFLIKQPLLAGLGGAISGGVLGGGATLYGNTIGAAYTGRGLTESGQAVDLLGKTMSGRYGAENAEYARNLVQGSEDKNKVQNRRLGVLAYQAAAYEAQVTETADRLAKAFGRKVELFDKGAENGYIENGYFKDGTIYINRSSQNPIAQVFSHELTHSLEGTEGYNALQSYVFTRMQEQGLDLKQVQIQKAEQYRKAGQTLATEAAVNSELLAEYVEKHLLTNEKEVLRLARTNQSVAYRVLDWIETAIAKVTGNEEKQYLLEARNLYRKALGESGEGLDTETQYSLTGKTEDGTEVYETSAETKALPWKARKQKFLDIMRNQYRGRTARFVADGDVLYARFDEKDLSKNIYGDKKSSAGGQDAKINVGADGGIFDLIENANYYGGSAERGKTAAAHRNVTRWEYFVKTVQIDGQVYDLVANVRKKPDGEYVYSIQLNENKKKPASPVAVPAKSSPALEWGTTGTNSISETGLPVKPQFSISEARDSQGNTLTADQEAYFKNSVVRDENGNLKPLWHGTNVDFNTFEKGDIGFHFGTYEQADARSRESGNQVMMECFLNLRNPLVLETDFGMWNANRIAEELAKQGILSNAEYRALQSIPGFAAEGYDSPGNAALRALLEAKGYDGIQYRNTFEGEENAYSYIVFHPNQVKFVNNLTPTQDPDMRFSISEAEEYERLLALARKWYGTTEKNAKIYENKSLEKVKQEYKAAVDNRIKDFVIRVRDAAKKDKNAPNKMSIFLGQTNKREQDDIKAITGVDITGYSRALPGNAVNHIEKRHGEKGNANQSMGDIDDLSRMQYVLDNYDYMEPLVNNDGKPSVSTAYINKDGTPAQQVRYVKRVNGDYYVVCVAQDTSKKRLVVISAYRSETIGTKKRTPVHGMLSWQNAQQLTPKASYQTTGILNNTIIPEVGNGVNISVAESEGKNNAKRLKNPVEAAKLTQEDANTTPAQKPRLGPGGPEKSAFADSLQRQGVFGEPFKEQAAADDEIAGYEGITNKETMQEALDTLDSGGQARTNAWFMTQPQNATAADVATGFILLKRYQDAGDYDSMLAVAEKLRNIGTGAGQTVQAFSILGRLTPEGMVMYAQKSLSDALERLQVARSKEWIDANAESFRLTPEDIDFIQNKVVQAGKLPVGRDKNILLGEIAARIQNKIPPTAGKSLKALARISMLLNPKTNVRNVLGNALIMPLRIVDDFTATAIDRQAAKKTGVRTTGRFQRDAVKSAKKGLYESFDDFRRGINTRELQGDRFEIGEGLSFGEKTPLGKALNTLDRVTSFLLDAGDRPFFEMWFTNSLNNQMRLNRATEATPDMIQIATQEALQRTWQDSNGYTDFVSGIRRGLNKINVKGYGLGDVFLPFVKTPANLTKAIVEYSPVGLVNALGKEALLFNRATKAGTVTPAMQKRMVDDIAKGITGTLLIAIFTALAKKGILRGAGDPDKDVANFERNVLGLQPYSVKIMDKTFSYEWMQPIGGTAAIVADIAKGLDSGNSKEYFTGGSQLERYANAILTAMQSGGNVLYNQSFMQGIQNLFSEDNMMQGLLEGILSEPSKFTPQVMGQIAQFGDDTARTSFVYGQPLQTAVNKVKAKVPGMREELEPVVDVMGREVETDNSAFNVFLNPANKYTENSTPEAKELYRLYQRTGEKSVIPPVAPYYFIVNGEKYIMTPEERTAYQKTTGKIISKELGGLMDTWRYKRLSDAGKVELVEKIAGYATAMAKVETNPKVSIGQEYQKAREAEKAGISPGIYFAVKAQLPDTPNKSEIETVIRRAALTKKQSYLLFSLWSNAKNNPFQ